MLAYPLLLLWSARRLGALNDVPACWCDEVGAGLRAVPLAGGHFLVEELPGQVAADLLVFFA